MGRHGPTSKAGLLGEYARALLRNHLWLPLSDRPAVTRFMSAVLEHEFDAGHGRRLPAVSVHDVIPEVRDARWTMLGRAWSVETPYLCGAVAALQARRVIEIGTFEGAMTLQMAANLPDDGRIITVDIDPVDVPAATVTVDAADRRLTDKARERIGRLYRDTPQAARITQLIQDSSTVDFAAYAEQYDVAYIDGGHSYEQVRVDTEKVLPLMRPGGVVFWHDYQPGCLGVRRYLHELAERLPIKNIRHTQLAVLRT